MRLKVLGNPMGRRQPSEVKNPAYVSVLDPEGSAAMPCRCALDFTRACRFADFGTAGGQGRGLAVAGGIDGPARVFRTGGAHAAAGPAAALAFRSVFAAGHGG